MMDNSRSQNHRNEHTYPCKAALFKRFRKENGRLPKQLGKFEQELKFSADVQTQNDTVVVSANGEEAPKRSVKDLAKMFKDISVHSSQIKELKPSSIKEGSDGRVLPVSVSARAKGFEKEMFDLKEQDKRLSPKKDGDGENSSCQSVRRQKPQLPQKMQPSSSNSNFHKNNAAAENTFQPVPKKRQNQPPPLMQVNLQKQQASSGPRYRLGPMTSQPEFKGFSQSQLPDHVVHPISVEPCGRFSDDILQQASSGPRYQLGPMISQPEFKGFSQSQGYHPNATQPDHSFPQPVLLPDRVVHPISVVPCGRFSDDILQVQGWMKLQK